MRKKPNGGPMTIYYRREGDRYRVWREGWFGDQFEVFTAIQFFIFAEACKRLSVHLVEANDD